jgi:Uma2 family endonuclease
MAAITLPQSMSLPLPPSTEVYRLTVDQYDRMVRDGTLEEDEPVELLDGILVIKMPKHAPHRVGVRKTVRALERVLPTGWHIAKEEALVIGPRSKPEPDAAVIRGDLEFDATRDAAAADCALVVEVAESSLSRDRTEKGAIFDRGGIAVYWIINLIDRQVEAYTDPDPSSGYRNRADYHPGDDVPVVIAGCEVGRIAVADLLP